MRLFQVGERADANVAETGAGLVEALAAGVDLEGEGALGRDAGGGLLGVLEVGDQDAVEPDEDAGGFTGAADAQLVPGVFSEVVDAVGAGVDAAVGPGAVDRADLAAGTVVEGNLVALAIGADAEEDARVEGPVNFSLAAEFEVTEGFGCGQESPPVRAGPAGRRWRGFPRSTCPRRRGRAGARGGASR